MSLNPKFAVQEIRERLQRISTAVRHAENALSDELNATADNKGLYEAIAKWSQELRDDVEALNAKE